MEQISKTVKTITKIVGIILGTKIIITYTTEDSKIPECINAYATFSGEISDPIQRTNSVMVAMYSDLKKHVVINGKTIIEATPLVVEMEKELKAIFDSF